MDDSSEKCVRNPVHTCIQPHPYEPNGPAVGKNTSHSIPSCADAMSGDTVPSSAVPKLNETAAQVVAACESDVCASPDCTTATVQEDATMVHQADVAGTTTSSIPSQNNRDTAALISATSGVVVGDEELKPNGPLWVYLDRIAQYEGSNKDLYELCGAYVC